MTPPINLGILASSSAGYVAPYIEYSQHINYGVFNSNIDESFVFFGDIATNNSKYLLLTATNDNREEKQIINVVDSNLQVQTSYELEIRASGFFDSSDSSNLDGDIPPGLLACGFRRYSCDPVVYLFDIATLQSQVWANGNGIIIEDDNKGGYIDSVEVAVIAGDVIYDENIWTQGSIDNGNSGHPELFNSNTISFSNGPTDLLVFGAGFLDDDEVTMGADQQGNYSLSSSGFTNYNASSVLYYRLDENKTSPFQPLDWKASGIGNDAWVGMTFALRSTKGL